MSLSRTARLCAVLLGNLALVGALFVIGIAAHSLGVWAEGADYFADAAAIGASLLAAHLADRPATARRPDGYPRATRYAALLNAGWLFALCLLVAAGATDRLATRAHQVHGLPVLIVSAVAAIVMLGGALVLGGDVDNGGDDGAELSVRAVLLDTIADAAAAGGVAATGAVIYATHGNYWLDPTMALVVSVVVAYNAARLLGRIRLSLRT